MRGLRPGGLIPRSSVVARMKCAVSFAMARGMLLLVAATASAPVSAGHPEGRLDEATAAKEPAFEQVKGRPPSIAFGTRDKGRFDLRDLADKVVVLSFVPEGCGVPCADQQDLLAEVRTSLEPTPMRDMVRFVTIASDGTPSSSGGGNWSTAVPSDPFTVDEIRAEWRALSQRENEGPIVFVIGRAAGRAGIFHGSAFGRINMVLYINGLTNAHPSQPGLVDQVRSLFQ